MNPHNPTTTDMHDTERVFFNHMKALSQRAAYPGRWLHSFDLQCSDQWM